MRSTDHLEEELVLRRDREYFLQAHGTHLRDEEGKEIGILVVLNDLTRIRQLENLRRDFVANVSHELRTPITSIKGFVETLQDGALQKPADAERFLEIIRHHADRLNAIIEDLLSLSKIEREAEHGEVPLEAGDVNQVLEQAVQSSESRAKAKRIVIEAQPSDQVTALINSRLLEQAIVNLLDNAISYSDEGGLVKLGIEEREDEWIIFVRDNGCGMAPEHLHRIFERFYRIDRDRSRKLGGTGLGLAIVKHIALAHGGHISVESSPNEGSTFRIHLPKS
jgi:two-component system phosphate regulon sensor histidine kinase PhoR